MGASIAKNTGSIFEMLPSGHEPIHIVMLGLDGAGKTTVLYQLKFDQYLDSVPTIGFNCEKVRGNVGKSKGVQFLVWDVGGQEKLRPLWKSYTRCTDGIIFVVDSENFKRMEEAKIELQRTIKHHQNQNVPILVFANKQDLPGAKSAKDLEQLLGMNEIKLNSLLTSSQFYNKQLQSEMTNFKGWHIEKACALTGDGLHNGLEILYEMITKQKKINKILRKKR